MNTPWTTRTRAWLVVDREGLAAEFLFHLHCQGRRVITLLPSRQSADEDSFTDVGEWIRLSG